MVYTMLSIIFLSVCSSLLWMPRQGHAQSQFNLLFVFIVLNVFSLKIFSQKLKKKKNDYYGESFQSNWKFLVNEKEEEDDFKEKKAIACNSCNSYSDSNNWNYEPRISCTNKSS